MTILSNGTLLDGFAFGDNGDQAGGYVTGLNIVYDGAGRTMAITTDVYNGGIKGPLDTIWRQAFTPTSLPVGDAQYDASFYLRNNKVHCYALVFAPSDHTRGYGTYNAGLYVTSDTGNTWTRMSSFPFPTTGTGVQMDTNLGVHPGNGGPKIAVDNSNKDVMLLGTQRDGLWYSTNGASVTQTFIQVSGANVVNATDLNGLQWGTRVAVDPTSTQLSGVRQTWYAMMHGTGLFKSTTGPGGSYTQISGSTLGGPSGFVWEVICDQNGLVWVTEKSGSIWRYNGTTWTDLTGTKGAPGAMVSLAINPNVAVIPGTSGYIYAFDNGQFCSYSINGGDTWHSKITGSAQSNNTFNMFPSVCSWLGKGNNLGPTGAIAKFDPSVAGSPGKIYMTSGIGIYYCTPPILLSPGTKNFFNWYEESQGQKELVANKALILPGGRGIVLACWDRPLWYQSDIGVTPLGPYRPLQSPQYDASRNIDYFVDHCWDVEYAADDPNWVFAYINFKTPTSLGYSTNGGKTWNLCASQPVFAKNVTAGCIAVGNKGNVVVIPSNNGQPIYTKDSGATWNNLPISGLNPVSGETGLGASYTTHAYVITYDRTGGAFYLYDYKGPTVAGIYKSTDGGDTWTRPLIGKLDTYTKQPLRLHAVPGQAGVLLYTAGDLTNNTMLMSIDGGQTFNPEPSGTITNVSCIGFGKAAPSSSYSTVYIHGAKSGVYGVYYSTDNCNTWNFMATYPHNNGDTPLWITGHPDKYGWGIIGYQGSGFHYFKPNYPITITPS